MVHGRTAACSALTLRSKGQSSNLNPNPGFNLCGGDGLGCAPACLHVDTTAHFSG